MTIDVDHAFAVYGVLYGTPVGSRRAGLVALLGFLAGDDTITDPRWAAYLLATVDHECAHTWQPIEERGPRSYFDKYEKHTAIGQRLGNLQTGDGYRFRGRGYIMPTGRGNYARLSTALGLDGTADDLIAYPERALRPDISYRIASVGMVRGLFTGKKFADYLGARTDYLNARRIINGIDRAEPIAATARAFLRCFP